MCRRPRNFGNRVHTRVSFSACENESLRNGCVYRHTINTAPINFSWRNNPLSGATSYRSRHEVEKGSTCSATEFYIRPAGELAMRKSTRGFSPCGRIKMKI